VAEEGVEVMGQGQLLWHQESVLRATAGSSHAKQGRALEDLFLGVGGDGGAHQPGLQGMGS